MTQGISKRDSARDFVDILIVGAGLSGIGAACHLQRRCPGRSYAVLESRQTMGGTWDLFRYPGVRSDSDMYTLGYTFKPWTHADAIADGQSILNYIRETAQEHGIDRHIRYQHTVKAVEWCSDSASWTVLVARGEADTIEIACHFLYVCSGYYDYDQGYTPVFNGRDDFAGRVVHAQHWPEGLDYKDQRVVVIGSGATAVTLIPELARQAAHTVMLQRSPGYIASVPTQDGMVDWLRQWLPIAWVYRLARWKRVLHQMTVFNLARWLPEKMKHYLLQKVSEELGPDYDVEKHFTPDYNPWDQRLCAVPDSDLFAAIRQQRAEVVTDNIDCFTKTGIRLASGRHLDADLIVLATGLNLKILGGMTVTVDGEAVNLADRFTYFGVMLSNIPNLAYTIGYTNSSWTLKADLTARYVCRILNHMQKNAARVVRPELDGDGMVQRPILNFTSGYVLRAVDQLPKQSDKRPWKAYQNYFLDLISLRFGSLTRSVLKFHK